MDLIKAEEIKKSWQEHTELYKKDLRDPDNHDGVITQLEPDILECEVKWALGSIPTNKASTGDGIPVYTNQLNLLSVLPMGRKLCLGALGCTEHSTIFTLRYHRVQCRSLL